MIKPRGIYFGLMNPSLDAVKIISDQIHFSTISHLLTLTVNSMIKKSSYNYI